MAVDPLRRQHLLTVDRVFAMFFNYKSAVVVFMTNRHVVFFTDLDKLFYKSILTIALHLLTGCFVVSNHDKIYLQLSPVQIANIAPSISWLSFFCYDVESEAGLFS